MMIEYKYIVSTIVMIILFGFLITMIYILRSTIVIPKGPYTWITNLCTFVLFLLVIVCLFLGLAYNSPVDLRNGNIPEHESEYNLLKSLDLSSDLSTFVSKNAMFPLLVVEMMLYVSMNSRLLWIWFSTGEWDTIVNKFIIIQRTGGIIYMVGCVVDYGLRLYILESFTFLPAGTYCSCWIIFYKTLFYATSLSLFAAALVRLLCVEFPLEYHNR